MAFRKNRIVLASKSPRRSQLLEMAGLSFIQKTREVEENYAADLKVEEVPVFLAQKKARACIDFLETPQDVLLAADSVVILDDTIFGKPTDVEDAKRILGLLSGREHCVVTGVCMLDKEKEIAFGEASFVKFAELTEAEINFYINKYQPFDKAGAYAIQEWIGLCKIESIKGTYANVMGLPVHRVYEELSNW